MRTKQENKARYRRLLAVLLLLALAVPLAGCSAFESQMAKTTSKMGKLQSFHVDVDIRLEDITHVGRQDLELDAKVTGGLDMETDPLLLKTDLKLEALGIERDLHYYITKDYDTVTIYPYDKEKQLKSIALTQSSARRIKTLQALKLLIKCGDYFADPVEDTLDGEAAKRYDGLFPEEYVEEALVLLGLEKVKEAVSEENADGEASGEDADLSGAIPEKKDAEAGNASGSDAVQAASERRDRGDEGGIPGRMWVDSDDMILAVEIDIASFAQKLVDDVVQTILEEYDLDGLELDVELTSMDCMFRFSQFNDVDNLSIPE